VELNAPQRERISAHISSTYHTDKNRKKDVELRMAAPERLLVPPVSWQPRLIVVVDTEEEFDWQAPFDAASTSVRNIAFQPLAQDVLSKSHVVPTYVVDYPVAISPYSVELLSKFADQGRAEIGAHLHPWVTPPAEGPVDTYSSYPGNLPPDLERKKLEVLTDSIVGNYGIVPKIYKAGRYGIGVKTPETLRALQYSVDVSVVPYTNYSSDGGPNFDAISPRPFMLVDEVCELPLSVNFVGPLAFLGPYLFPRLQKPALRALRLPGICGRLGLLERLRLSPEGHTLRDLIRQTRAALSMGVRLFMLTYHSSSLLPGATPYVRDSMDRGAFLSRLDGYLRFFIDEVGGRMDTPVRVAAELMSSRNAS
jgi:hypothetical protein